LRRVDPYPREVAPAGRLDPPDTVCLDVTGAAGKKTLAHPGRATTVNGLASIAFGDASSSLPIDFSAVRVGGCTIARL